MQDKHIAVGPGRQPSRLRSPLCHWFDPQLGGKLLSLPMFHVTHLVFIQTHKEANEDSSPMARSVSEFGQGESASEFTISPRTSSNAIGAALPTVLCCLPDFAGVAGRLKQCQNQLSQSKVRRRDSGLDQTSG